MSDPSGMSTVNHNDDQDESTNRNSSSTNISHGKFANLNSRITSPHILKLQQTFETESANNQAYDEIHEVQSKHSHTKKNFNEERKTTTFSSNHQISRDLMQSNYYDQTRFDPNHNSSPSKLSSERVLDINVEDYKKRIALSSNNKKTNSQYQVHLPPFGETPESIQEGIAQSASGLLEVNKSLNEQINSNENSMKKMNKTHENAALDYFPNQEINEDEDRMTKQRSGSSSSECSASDSSTSTNEQQSSSKFDSETTFPYQKLSEEDEDDEPLNVEKETKTNVNESTNLLTKTQPTTYGTQTLNKTTTTERAKYLRNNGYNSQGSSVTTKSSSDNGGSVQTNSGSENDEESDEEHYNNSTLATNSRTTSNNPRANDSSTKMLNNKMNDHRYVENSSYSNENFKHRSSGVHFDKEVQNRDEQHLQVPRFKQNSTDDPNETQNRKDNGSADHSSGSSYAKKWSTQASGNISSSSSQQTGNLFDRSDQPSSSNSNRRAPMKVLKKRKQSHKQEVILTDLIPGHRGNLDVDELVMFIDGNSSKPSSNNNETKTNSLAESNSNKAGSKKKSRKPSKTAQLTRTPSNEQIETSPSTNETLTEINIEQIEKVEEKPISSSENTKNQISSKRPDWFEQVIQASNEQDNEEIDQSTSTVNKDPTPLNSTATTDSFVTVTRRRPIKERRQDSNPSFAASSRFSVTTNPTNHEKRRYTSISQQENIRSSPRNSLTQIKTNISSSAKDENLHSTNQQEIVNEKVQSSPHLSSQSSSSSLPSLAKRQSKPPPVVFLNKSINVELDDVSFGFDVDSVIINKSTNENLPNELSAPVEDKDNLQTDPTSITPVSVSNLTHQEVTINEHFTDTNTQNFNERSVPMRTARDPQFYSGPDIRPHHRTYPAATVSTGHNYIDPRFLISYNQARYTGYPSHLGYMNYIRTPYISSQHQYVILPSNNFTTKTETETDDKSCDEFNTSTTTDPVHEPLLVYATVPNPTGPLYYHHHHPTATTTTTTTTAPSTVYPTPMFYPRIPQQPIANNIFPSPTAYFQPINSPSLFIETKIDQQETDQTNYEYSNPSKSYSNNEQLPSTSSDIMSSALQLVYSRQRQNAQTDRFNLDDLTAYLTMKWRETVNHYDQGDSQIMFIDHHE